MGCFVNALQAFHKERAREQQQQQQQQQQHDHQGHTFKRGGESSFSHNTRKKKKPVEESKDSFFQLFPPPSFSLHFPFSALRTLAHLPSSLLSTLFD